jgi:hypothetical protein
MPPSTLHGSPRCAESCLGHTACAVLEEQCAPAARNCQWPQEITQWQCSNELGLHSKLHMLISGTFTMAFSGKRPLQSPRTPRARLPSFACSLAAAAPQRSPQRPRCTTSPMGTPAGPTLVPWPCPTPCSPAQQATALAMGGSRWPSRRHRVRCTRAGGQVWTMLCTPQTVAQVGADV